MCGIFAVKTLDNNAIQQTTDGLKRLEYRGYDSCGIAFLDDNLKHFTVIRAVGGVNNIAYFDGSSTAIGHTRWATNGKVSKENAHPHTYGKVHVVHNGIIENYKELVEKYKPDLKTNCDTELIAWIANYYSISEIFKRIRGNNTIVLTRDGFQGIYFGCSGGSLMLGKSKDGRSYYISSDINSLPTDLVYIVPQHATGSIISTDEKQIWCNGCKVNFEKVVKSKGKDTNIGASNPMQSDCNDLMLSEILEQPHVISNCIDELDKFDYNYKPEITNLVGCGSSYYAALYGKYTLEELAGLLCNAEIASEFAWRKSVCFQNSQMIALTQSGETADTLNAVKYSFINNRPVIYTLTNNPHSVISNFSQCINLNVGPEYGVAATKTFTAQLFALLNIGMRSPARGGSKEYEGIKVVNNGIIDGISTILEKKDEIRELALKHRHMNNCFFLGRGPNYPIALEGALKLKEVSYINAQGYAAAEMKHGPLSLIEEGTPVIFLGHDEKIQGNIDEIKARGGQIIEFSHRPEATFNIPGIYKYTEAILAAVFVQLFAYYMGKYLGRNVDRPRNLAKSVTV